MAASAGARTSPTTISGSSSAAFSRSEWALLGGVALMWGSSFLLMDLALDSLDPGVIATIRLLLGVATLAVFPRARTPVARADLPRIALLGVLWMGIPMLLFPIAQQWVDSAVAGMINGAMPVTAAIWAIVLWRRVPGYWQLLGIGTGCCGIVAIALPELGGTRTTTFGVILIIVAVILYGVSANIAAPLQQRYGSLPVLVRAQLVALLVVLPFGLAGLQHSQWQTGPLLVMIPLGILCTGVAFVLMTTLIGRVGGPRGSLPTYFVPIVAVVLGALVLREDITFSAIVGTGLVLVGAWMVSRSDRARGELPRRPVTSADRGMPD